MRLPGGYRDAGGAVHRQAILRQLTGRDEEYLAGWSERTSIPARVTGLLARCLCRLGPFEPVTPEMVRGLLVADRDYLLLVLRHISFGDRVQAVLVCPACAQKMDMDFHIDQVPVEAGAPAGVTERLELSPEASCADAAGTRHCRVEFRLPTGEDQEHLAALEGRTESGALDALLDRCLVRLGDMEPVAEPAAASLSAQARREIEDCMERRSPRVDLEMDLTCPECGHAFVHWLDFPSLFFAEVALRREQLYREVHLLALHYHWSESEILGLSRGKRRTYLDLVRADRERRSPFMEG